MVNREEILFYGAILMVGSMLVKYTITKCLKSKCSKLLVCWGCLNIERNVDIELLESQLGIPNEEPMDIIPPAILPLIAGAIPIAGPVLAPVLSTIIPAVTQMMLPTAPPPPLPRSISPMAVRPSTPSSQRSISPMPTRSLERPQLYNNNGMYQPSPIYPTHPYYYPK